MSPPHQHHLYHGQIVLIGATPQLLPTPHAYPDTNGNALLRFVSWLSLKRTPHLGRRSGLATWLPAMDIQPLVGNSVANRYVVEEEIVWPFNLPLRCE